MTNEVDGYDKMDNEAKSHELRTQPAHAACGGREMNLHFKLAYI